MVITSAGKVGIGTTSPEKTLDVAGMLRIASAATELHFHETSRPLPNGLWRLTDGGSGTAGDNMVLQENTHSSGNFSTVNTAIYFKSGGNVGIGTTTPTAKLEVNGTAKFNNTVTFAPGQTFTGDGSGLTNLNTASLTSGTAGISITGNAATATSATTAGTATSATTAQTATSATTAGTATNAINLNGIAGTSYARLDIANIFSANQTINGNLGIGTTGQTRRLDVFTSVSNLAAVKAIAQTASSTGNSVTENQIGLWGDSDVGSGLLGTSDTGGAITGFSSTSSQVATAFFQNLNAAGRALGAGGPILGCTIYGNGTMSCGGGKAAEVGLSDGRKVLLYAVESPEIWFEDFGSGVLEGGTATVAFDPVFADTVNLDLEYRVFLTPRGDCEGLYIASQTPNGFEVRELRGGKSDVQFDYRVIAHRKGWENVRLTDVTETSYEKTRAGTMSALSVR